MVITAPPEVIAGSSISLNCTIKFSLAVDILLDVSVHWTGPNNFVRNSNGRVTESINEYSSTTTVDAARNGTYSCEATVTSHYIRTTDNVTRSTSIRVITGEPILGGKSFTVH